jgi:hypothetical protein
LRTILDEKKRFSLLELDGVQVPASVLGSIIWGKANSDTLHVERIVAHGVNIESKAVTLPSFSADVRLD